MRAASAFGSSTDSIDPALHSSGYARLLLFGYLNRLAEVDSSGNIIPELAEQWESTPDAMKWTFSLKRGVEFHNGKTLDADDVVATVNYHRGENSHSAINSLVKQISSVESDGPNTVRFVLTEPNADFVAVMTAPEMGILPLIGGKLEPLAGIGTGGYRIDELKFGVRSLLKRNPNYFKSNRAHFDSVELLAIPDDTARENALISNAVDAIERINPRTASLLSQREGVELLEVIGRLHFTFPMLADVAPFDNNDVRLALKHAIDRQALLDVVLGGHGTLGNDQPLSQAYSFFDPSLPQRTYDLDRAKHHLRKAGLENLKVTLSASDAIWTGAVDAIQLYRENAAPAGIDIQVNRVPNDGYWSDVWMKHPWCAAYWSGRPTADWMLTQAYSGKSSWNDTHWKNDAFERLLVAARGEIDQTKRAEMYAELQRIVHDEGGAVIPLFAHNIDAVSNRVGHPATIAGNWEMDGAMFMERWWFV